MFRKMIIFHTNPRRRRDFGENPRTNGWLKKRLTELQNRYFPEIKLTDRLIIKFGRPTKTRLGSIKYGRRKINPNTIITINGHFQDQRIPDFVVDSTILHELTHYAHGWFSPYPQFSRYPHQGGIIQKELTKRGVSDILKLSRQWLKKNWKDYLRQYHFN